MSSSTSSSERSTSRPRRWLVAVGILLVLFGGEVAARFMAPGFGQNGDWPSVETFVKHEQMTELDDVHTVYVGTSFAAFGIDSAVIADRTNQIHYNAGLSAAGFEILDAWTRDMVVPLAEPERVVLALGHIDLNDSDVDNRRRFFEAPAVSHYDNPSQLRRVEVALQHVSTLFEYRRQFRNPRDVGRAVVSRDFPEFWGAFGERQDDFSNEPIRASWETSSALPTAAQLARLEELVDWLHDNDIEVVLVFMPTAEGFLVPEADDAAIESLHTIGSSANVPVIDGRDYVTDPALFFDGVHLNPLGQEAFSEALAAVLG